MGMDAHLGGGYTHSTGSKLLQRTGVERFGPDDIGIVDPDHASETGALRQIGHGMGHVSRSFTTVPWTSVSR